MPLLDHFRPPISKRYPWESFHTIWAAAIASRLNRHVLPEGLYAAAQIHLGGRVEVDVATLERNGTVVAPAAASQSGPVAVATWAPPAATLVMPVVFPDEFEIQIIRASGGDTLVGAIALISPGNKDRPDTRRAFAAKCAAFLQQGIGLVIVDVVTERQANLHDELIRLLQQPDRFALAQLADLYSVAYRPARKPSGDQVEIWPAALVLGQALPTMPLALRGVGIVPVDLETSYQTTREDTRL
jgi:hypothetical protein